MWVPYIVDIDLVCLQRDSVLGLAPVGTGSIVLQDERLKAAIFSSIIAVGVEHLQLAAVP